MVVQAFETMTPAQRAHTRRVIWLMIAYAVILPPLLWLRANHALSSPAAVVWVVAQGFAPLFLRGEA